jgi:hypothetical protein
VLRLDHARRAMARQAEGSIDEQSILATMHSHRGGFASICRHPAPDAPFGDRWRTLATVSVEPASRRMTLRRGGPCGDVHAVTLSSAAQDDRFHDPARLNVRLP